MLAIGWGNTWQHQRCDVVKHDTQPVSHDSGTLYDTGHGTAL